MWSYWVVFQIYQRAINLMDLYFRWQYLKWFRIGNLIAFSFKATHARSIVKLSKLNESKLLFLKADWPGCPLLIANGINYTLTFIKIQPFPWKHHFISMGQCKTAVTTLLTHWSYCSLILTHRFYYPFAMVTTGYCEVQHGATPAMVISE